MRNELWQLGDFKWIPLPGVSARGPPVFRNNISYSTVYFIRRSYHAEHLKLPKLLFVDVLTADSRRFLIVSQNERGDGCSTCDSGWTTYQGTAYEYDKPDDLSLTFTDRKFSAMWRMISDGTIKTREEDRSRYPYFSKELIVPRKFWRLTKAIKDASRSPSTQPGL